MSKSFYHNAILWIFCRLVLASVGSRHEKISARSQAIGVSCGGKTTKNHAFVTENFQLIGLLLTGGQIHDYDKELYKRRNEIERFFRRLKAFRRIFIHYDKLDTVFAGFILSGMIVNSLV